MPSTCTLVSAKWKFDTGTEVDVVATVTMLDADTFDAVYAMCAASENDLPDPPPIPSGCGSPLTWNLQIPAQYVGVIAAPSRSSPMKCRPYLAYHTPKTSGGDIVNVAAYS